MMVPGISGTIHIRLCYGNWGFRIPTRYAVSNAPLTAKLFFPPSRSSLVPRRGLIERCRLAC